MMVVLQFGGKGSISSSFSCINGEMVSLHLHRINENGCDDDNNEAAVLTCCSVLFLLKEHVNTIFSPLS
eukprot:8533138-Ditylum_brightwellii.AAC.1